MLDTSSTLWDQALNALRGEIDTESYTTWFEPVEYLGFENGWVNLLVPTAFYRNWLINNYQETMKNILTDLLGAKVSIRYHVHDKEGDPEPGNRPETEAWPSSASRAMDLVAPEIRPSQAHERPTELITCPFNPNYTFDMFVVGECNRFACAAAEAVADPHTRAYNPLFIYGGVGLGKTHLMQAIGQELQSYGEHLRVLYVSSEAFMNAFIESVAQKKLPNFRNYFRNVDLLLVDDVQFLSGAEKTQTEFFHTFNVLFDAGKKIVLSSDAPPKELQRLEERIRSRFEWGLIVDIQPPDLETRDAILRRKARMRGIELDAEVSIYIAERVKTNLRKLEGALTRIAAHSSITKQTITLDLARQLLGPFLGGEEPRRISAEKIQTVVCDYFDISIHELTGSNRSRRFAHPRQIAAYLCRELTDLSFPELARKFGGRDHTSIIHAHRKVRDAMAADLTLQNRIREFTKQVKGEAPAHRAPE